jgi:hypothetical protein
MASWVLLTAAARGRPVVELVSIGTVVLTGLVMIWAANDALRARRGLNSVAAFTIVLLVVLRLGLEALR